MNWVITLAIAFLIAGGVLLIAFAAYASRRAAPGSHALTVLLLATAFWSLAYALQLGFDTLEGKLFWNGLKFIGVEVVPLAWVAFAASYTGWGRGRPRAALRLALLPFLIEPFVSLSLLFTNDSHNLFYQSVTLNAENAILPPTWIHGPAFWVHTIFSYALLVAGTLILVWGVLRSPVVFRRQAGALIVALGAPLALNVLSVFRLTPLNGLDLTPFGFTVTCLALGFGLFRFQAFDTFFGLVPVAHDAVIAWLPDGVFVLDPRLRLLDLNPAAARIIDRPVREVVGQPLSVVHPDLGRLLDLASDGEVVEITLRSAAGERVYDISVTVLTRDHGSSSGRVLVMRDVTERHRQAERLKYLSSHDSLTGLPNRSLFEQRLRAVLAAPGPANGFLLYLDLDGFKQVNDTLGHACGDRTLVEVVQSVRAALGPEPLFARLGGDEFAVLLLGVGESEACDVVDRIGAAVEGVGEGYAPFDLSLGVSIGAATIRERSSYDGLISAADEAMYRAKSRSLSQHAEQAVAVPACQSGDRDGRMAALAR